MKNKSKHFTETIVWQKIHALTLLIYNITKTFPKEELFGLTSQIRRAAASIPANIAEGYARNGIKDKIKFYNISEGSLYEVLYFIIFTKDLNYYDKFEVINKTIEVSKMLNSYSQKINQTILSIS